MFYYFLYFSCYFIIYISQSGENQHCQRVKNSLSFVINNNQTDSDLILYGSAAKDTKIFAFNEFDFGFLSPDHFNLNIDEANLSGKEFVNSRRNLYDRHNHEQVEECIECDDKLMNVTKNENTTSNFRPKEHCGHEKPKVTMTKSGLCFIEDGDQQVILNMNCPK